MHDDLSPPRRLTPDQAAALIGVSPKTLANWRSLGKGPSWFTRPGVWYLESDVQRWLRQGRHRSVA